MNAPNSLSPDQQAAERKAYEPSMEEILASIRRIIADDQAILSPPPEPPKMAEPQAASGAPRGGLAEPGWDFAIEALLAESAAKPRVPERNAPDLSEPKPRPVAEPNMAELQTPLSQPKPQIEARQADEAAPPRLDDSKAGRDAWRGPERRRPFPGTQAVKSEDPLVSPATDAAVSAAFDSLLASRFLQSSEGMNDVVREMIRPMLKAWLDDNLPILVERLVRAEIERVARGGGR
jgi:uncharacterized protein